MRWLILSAALCLADTADASDWHLDASLGTDFPISLHGAVTVEGPYRLRARLGIGWMPGGYLDVINGIITGFGWYDDATAALIQAVLKDSLIVHPELGWRPVENAGFHFDVGYQMAGLGGSLSAVETVEALTGNDLPAEASEAAIDLQAAATDHMLTVNLGWEFVIKDRLIIDTGLGGAFSMSASSELTPNLNTGRTGPGYDAMLAELDETMGEGETLLNETLTKYVHSPMIRIAVGYRFF